ncbi:MAG: inorganic phosphate transporter [Nitrososphaerota archaeon]|jgi:PiT family inorganic phosphate transporter|nr:inorganic phosphate transporter [Nitrososphaerota archaeon]MDG6927334.1 inorganic phosphate transporter [Nitrososphaerota archaeon]MDG6930938.1 inorganic phosphate transporter [Nitrososphaerota archaeon]MDG6932238.1 inorganic phosphate transporter [Nitrososphaerota archaeon]MDG6935769.1 inorganic phosphate transporter [Nitrososphaerota archaeon]
MTLDFIIEIILLVLLIYLFGLNNGSVFEGGLAGSGLYNYASAAIIVGVGIFLGTLIQGRYTGTFAEEMGGVLSGNAAIILLLVQLALFLAFTFINLPLSITQSLVGGWLSVLLILGIIIKPGPMDSLFFWWVVSPFISMAFTAVFYKAVRRLSFHFPISSVSYTSRISALVLVFYTSFVLGANNVGFIMGAFGLNYFILILLAIAASIGALGASRMSKAIGEDLIVAGPLGITSALLGGTTVLLFLTYLGLPASLTTTILGALIGVGIASKPRLFNKRYLVLVVLSWIMAFVMGFAIVYGIFAPLRVLLHF